MERHGLFEGIAHALGAVQGSADGGVQPLCALFGREIVLVYLIVGAKEGRVVDLLAHASCAVSIDLMERFEQATTEMADERDRVL